MHWSIACTGILLALGACSGRDSLQKRAHELSFEKVLMQRSACYGRCPVYAVTISSDGKVTFRGEKFVAYMGEHTGFARTNDLLRLDQAIAAVQFFSLRPESGSPEDGCTTWTTDNSTVVINVTAGGREHQVSYYYGCEVDVGPSIDMLSKTIDEVARAQRWVGRGAL